MAEPFKNLFNPTLITGMADNLARCSDDFDRAHFLKVALENLDALELSERSTQIENAIDAAFSSGFHECVAAMLRSLHPVTNAQLSQMKTDDTGVAGWAIMPMAGYIARHGLHAPQISLNALREMTMRSSSEFAVRPFFRDHTELTLQAATQWASDANVHVRRLASEGSRPRLPWGIRLQGFVANPAPILPILTKLRDDPSEYVRRSVANNLNDIAKDHPDLVSEIAVDWLKTTDEQRRRLVRHACRSLIKDGHAATLAAFGFQAPDLRRCAVTLSGNAVHVGDILGINLNLTGGDRPQKLSIDYVMHFMRANGKTSPKVFKWKVVSLKAHEALSLTKMHSYKKVTTRKDYPGQQRVSVRINGVDFDGPTYELSA